MSSPITLIPPAESPLYHERPKSIRLADPKKGPPDECNLVYIIVFLLGIGAHFPWNVLLAGQDYFKSRLQHVPMARDFLSHFTIIFMSVKYLITLTAMFSLRKHNPKWQVYASFIGNILAFFGLLSMCCTTFFTPNTLYLALLFLVLAASIFSALSDSGLLGILSQFPVEYTQVFFVGHGFAGILVMAVNIAAYFYAGTFQTAAFSNFYFGLSAGLLCGCLVLFSLLQTSKFYRYYYVVIEEMLEARDREVEEHLKQLQSCSLITEVYDSVKGFLWAGFISSTIAFIIFPVFMFSTRSVHCGTSAESWFHRDMFVPMALVFANVFDLLGKFIPSIPGLDFKEGPHSLVSLSRVVFIPLYLFGNIKIKGYKLPFSPYLASDYFFFTLVSMSTLTSSYLYTVFMMWAPAKVPPKERTLAIALLIMASALGFIVGTCISMAGKALVIKYSTPIV